MSHHRPRFLRILLLLAGVAIVTLTILELQHLQGEQTRRELAAIQQVLDEREAIGREIVAIQRVLDRQTAAWNRGDLEGFMAGYWNAPTLTFFSGKEPRLGWQATIERYRERYQGEGREMGQVSFKDVQIEVPNPGHAWVRGQWQVVTSKETLGGLFTLIMMKTPEGWRIVHDHTSGG